MSSGNGILIVVALALLAVVCHAAIGAGSDDGASTAHAIAGNTVTNDTSSIPDFDGDGTIGFGDFLIFAGVFGARQGDEKYEAKYDLNGDGEIGFSDFVIFAQNFGKEAPSPVVAIPDPNLRTAIETALNKDSGAPITVAEMETLTRFSATNAGIRNLRGLEFATNLPVLRLDFNDITDLSPLAGLTNLTRLHLEFNNNITDLSPLAGLTNLKILGLYGSNIPDLSPLSGLTKLKELWAIQCNIADVSPLSELTNLKILVLADNNNIPDLSPLSGLTKLKILGLRGTNSTDVSPLSGLTNLTSLGLSNNQIADISPLSGLTNLTRLELGFNNVTDILALSGLTNLTELWLNDNNITDISALSGLTNLMELNLVLNNIADISALSGLTNLMELNLVLNRITDISALSGLTNLRNLDLRGNPLSGSTITEHVPALESNGAAVLFDALRKGEFDIELVMLHDFTEIQQRALQYVARRWMAVIVEDLRDYEFTEGWSGTCNGQWIEIAPGERIDDLRIYVSAYEGLGLGFGGPNLLREETHLPVLGCMAFQLSYADLLNTGLHEVGHVLGFGTVWGELGLIRDHSSDDPNVDTHFNGPLAIAAFDDAGGTGYTGAKVPVKKMDGAHWRGSVLRGEVMTPWDGETLSAITVQSFADLGYGVDVSQADAYNLPGAAGKAVAKIAVSAPSILGDVRTGRFEGAEPIWGRGATFDLPDNQWTWGTGSPAHAEPELTCGAGLMNEPIYVVDRRGRVVRTIHR